MDLKDTTVVLSAESDKEETASFGKFRTADDLVKAYNALESEFTKRSQRLKEIEAANTSSTDWEGKVGDFVKNYPVAERYTDELAQEIAKNEKLLEKENCLESALLNVLTKKVKTAEEMASDSQVIEKVLKEEKNRETVINEYLTRIKQNAPPVTLPKGGAIPISPFARPRSIREAGEIAIKIIDTI